MLRVGHGILARRFAASIMALSLAGCMAPVEDLSTPASGVATSSDGASSGAEQSVTPAFSAYIPVRWADYGSHAIVRIESLNVHRFLPGLDAEVGAVLEGGEDVFVVDGPITLDGYEWYQIEFAATASEFPEGIGEGWVAGRPEPNPQGEASYLQLGPASCVGAVDTATLARMAPLAVESCDVQVTSVSGLVDQCYERPLTPFSYEPDWAAFSCLFLRDQASTWVLPLAFPPDSSVPELERGDIVTLTGGLGFDSAKYGACTVSGPDSTLEANSLVWALSCQHRFVVTGGTIDGHLELPPMYP
jgi:hypothetical protein